MYIFNYLNQTFRWFYKKAKQYITKNDQVLNNSVIANIQRIYYMFIIGIPVSLIHVVYFYLQPAQTATQALWHKGIILSHISLAITLTIFFFLSNKLKKQVKPSKFMYFFQYVAITIVLIAGLVIVSIDQLVTTNLTPFIIACFLVGTYFVNRPLISFFTFVISYILFFNLITLPNSTTSVLLSSRVNGITVISMGFTLSLITWNNFYVNTMQKRKIELQQHQLKQMAYYDSLTSLPNRRYFEKKLNKEIATNRCCNQDACLIILDIDHFKLINDTYGHITGDSILKQIGYLLDKSIEHAFCARWGGEEFTILLSNTSLNEAHSIAEQLRLLIMKHPFWVSNHKIKITASFGVSSLNCHNLANYSELADKALYKAKQMGRNRVEIA